MKTVCTLAPANADFPLNWFGQLFAPPNVRKIVVYPNMAWWNMVGSALLGMAALDAELLKVTQPTDIIGHSMGAQIIGEWLRTKGPTSAVDPTKVRFIQTGNPERKYGGAMYSPNRPWWITPAYGGLGVPAGNRYKVVDLARKNDFWADYDNAQKLNNWWATMGIHVTYDQVQVDGPGNTLIATENNVTYLSAP